MWASKFILYAFAYRFVMVLAQVLEKSSSPMVLGAGSWWEALQNRYVITPVLCLTFQWEINMTRTVWRLFLDVEAASGVDRGPSHPIALCLCSGPLWRLCIWWGKTPFFVYLYSILKCICVGSVFWHSHLPLLNLIVYTIVMQCIFIPPHHWGNTLEHH